MKSFTYTYRVNYKGHVEPGVYMLKILAGKETTARKRLQGQYLPGVELVIASIEEEPVIKKK